MTSFWFAVVTKYCLVIVNKSNRGTAFSRVLEIRKAYKLSFDKCNENISLWRIYCDVWAEFLMLRTGTSVQVECHNEVSCSTKAVHFLTIFPMTILHAVGLKYLCLSCFVNIGGGVGASSTGTSAITLWAYVRIFLCYSTRNSSQSHLH